jgi:putative alpha-1,2-mannosidase
MPIVCDGGFQNCPVSLDARAVNRTIPGKDIASPGYFSTTLQNGVQMEATSTRRAGLIRYTYPLSTFAKARGGTPTIVFDCSNDLPGTWRGGKCQLDKAKGRIMLSGTWGSSFASGIFSYKAHACYDLTNSGANVIDQAGLWAADRFGMSAVDESKTYANLTRNTIGGQPIQTGAVVSFKQYPTVNGLDAQITFRAGVSFVSAEQACQNAESEVPAFDFDAVVAQSRALWNEKLNRVQISNATNSTVATMLYTSLYRASLTPNNATGETQGAYVGTQAPYFDSL